MEREPRVTGGTAPLPGGRKALFLVVPWLFLVVLAAGAWRFIIPAVQEGAIHGYILGAVLLLLVASFGPAAVTMSRDVLAGRYP
jgi:hypothetical protein